MRRAGRSVRVIIKHIRDRFIPPLKTCSVRKDEEEEKKRKKGLLALTLNIFLAYCGISVFHFYFPPHFILTSTFLIPPDCPKKSTQGHHSYYYFFSSKKKTRTASPLSFPFKEYRSKTLLGKLLLLLLLWELDSKPAQILRMIPPFFSHLPKESYV